MKLLTDKALCFRTFPVVPRKRVKFEPDVPVEFSAFGSKQPLFECLGAYFTHHSFNLIDFFISRWAEIAEHKMAIMGQGSQIEKALEITPILGKDHVTAAYLQENAIELSRQLKDFSFIDRISDSELRSHPALSKLSSAALNEVIRRTAASKFKLIYPLRVIRTVKKKPHFGWQNLENLEDSSEWSSLFSCRLLEEKRGADGRVTERAYRFGFNSWLGIAMIHNTICSGHWAVNPKLYEVSGDVQLLYRYIVIGGARTNNQRIDYVGHRIGLKETQRGRLNEIIKSLLQELKEAGLIEDALVFSNSKKDGLCSFKVAKSKRLTPVALVEAEDRSKSWKKRA
jgi:hypothetical protein